MTTTEIINKNFVTIEWFFEEMQDELKPRWYQWRMEGKGSNGRKYQGLCQASEDHDLHDVTVTDVEEIEYDLPENWEPDYNGTTEGERNNQMANYQKLK